MKFLKHDSVVVKIEVKCGVAETIFYYMKSKTRDNND